MQKWIILGLHNLIHVCMYIIYFCLAIMLPFNSLSSVEHNVFPKFIDIKPVHFEKSRAYLLNMIAISMLSNYFVINCSLQQHKTPYYLILRHG